MSQISITNLLKKRLILRLNLLGIKEIFQKYFRVYYIPPKLRILTAPYFYLTMIKSSKFISAGFQNNKRARPNSQK